VPPEGTGDTLPGFLGRRAQECDGVGQLARWLEVCKPRCAMKAAVQKQRWGKGLKTSQDSARHPAAPQISLPVCCLIWRHSGGFQLWRRIRARTA
jgi:hypothetical protein